MNEQNTNTPFTRDWLKEAIQIAEGASTENLKRQHVKALYEAYIGVSKRHSNLQLMLQNVLKEVQKRRGLPVAPPPGRFGVQPNFPAQEKKS